MVDKGGDFRDGGSTHAPEIAQQRQGRAHIERKELPNFICNNLNLHGSNKSPVRSGSCNSKQLGEIHDLARDVLNVRVCLISCKEYASEAGDQNVCSGCGYGLVETYGVVTQPTYCMSHLDYGVHRAHDLLCKWVWVISLAVACAESYLIPRAYR